MAIAVKRLLTNAQLAKQIAYNAHQYIQQFDWQITLPKWEELFQKNRKITSRG
jgi:glycosyltransferase involved in cell wall biosynthesis